jgi:hypothetical protein
MRACFTTRTVAYMCNTREADKRTEAPKACAASGQPGSSSWRTLAETPHQDRRPIRTPSEKLQQPEAKALLDNAQICWLCGTYPPSLARMLVCTSARRLCLTCCQVGVSNGVCTAYHRQFLINCSRTTSGASCTHASAHYSQTVSGVQERAQAHIIRDLPSLFSPPRPSSALSNSLESSQRSRGVCVCVCVQNLERKAEGRSGDIRASSEVRGWTRVRAFSHACTCEEEVKMHLCANI